MSTTISTKEIRDGAITKEKIPGGAAIESSKLADGSNFLKKDGSLAMIGNFDAGNQKLVNVQTPSANGDAVNLSYLETRLAALNQIFKVKPNAKAATTGNITLTNPGTAIFDGVTLTAGDKLFVRAQSAPADNGLYTFNGSGVALTRIAEMDAWVEIPGAFFSIDEGTTYVDTIWLCTSNTGGTLGVTAINFTQVPTTAGLANSNFVDREVPSGAINGSNTAFVLANTPGAGSSLVILNGMIQNVGAGNDYTISGANITMLQAPIAGDTLLVNYRK